MMPPGGADARADQFEALERIQHDRITDPALGKLLDALEPWAASADPDSDDARADRRPQARPPQGGQRADRPRGGDLRRDRARAAGLAARRARRPTSALFQPALERVLELTHRYIACFDGDGRVRAPVRRPARRLRARPDHRGAARRCSRTIQEELVPLVSAAAAAGEDGRVFPGHFPQRGAAGARRGAAARRRLRRRALAPGPVGAPVRAQHGPHRRAAHDALGGGRPRDGVLLLPARVRARALRGADGPAHYRTTLAEATGLGVHESQSRLWENLVGRSKPFCEWVLPVLRATSAARSRRSRSPSSTAPSTRCGSR